jgi:NitT/TauT family transport system substrate-binding protein
MPRKYVRPLRAITAAASIACLFGALSAPAAAQEKKDVKVMMDWIIQGTHAPYFIAQQKGYYKQAGLDNVQIDAGKGATNVAVSVAGGAYDFGWVDMPAMIKFNASNPSSPLIAVYISFDDCPLAFVTLKSKNLRKPADLNGARIAGGPGTAVHDTADILFKAAKADNVKVNWLPVQPQLFGPMVLRGEADGTAGFVNSNLPALLDVGIKYEDIYPIKYSDFGANMYGLTLATTKAFAEKNPETVRAMVKALNKGTIDAIKDPAAALAAIKKVDPMMKEDVEKVRLDLALGLTNTAWVKKNGLSTAQPDRIKFTIDAVASAYGIQNPPKVEDVYTDKFLPPAAERKVN